MMFLKQLNLNKEEIEILKENIINLEKEKEKIQFELKDVQNKENQSSFKVMELKNILNIMKQKLKKTSEENFRYQMKSTDDVKKKKVIKFLSLIINILKIFKFYN